MPRNMSFMLTTEQVINRTKTVTRRLGWRNLKPGTTLQAVEKCQGLKKGEKVKRLRLVRVVSVRSEKLCSITLDDVRKEGFTELWQAPLWFCEMFMKHNRCAIDSEVTRASSSSIWTD